MTRLKTLPLWLSLLVLATATAPAHAQGGDAAARDTTTQRDTSQLVAREDSVRHNRSWLVGLLRKIARRSDDSLAVSTAADSAEAQAMHDSSVANAEISGVNAPAATVVRSFKSRKDSLEWVSAKRAAERATGLHIVVDIFAHELYVVDGEDTLRKASVATAMNSTLTYGGRSWRFETPRGVRRVLTKEKEPVWRPPEWHFAEVALEHHLKLRTLNRGQVIHLRDGTKLTVQGDEVGIIPPGSREFIPMVLDEHIVFDNTLFIPPADTKHRQIAGELGHFRLTLGDGYQLHGTPYANSIGAAVTHGCVRLHDEDVEWLYDNIPVGTKVYLF